MRERPLRKGDGRMAFVTIEDLRGQVEALFFSKAFAVSEDALKSGEPLLISGYVQLEGDDDSRTKRLRATEALQLGDVRRERTKRITLSVHSEKPLAPEMLAQVATICREYPGSCSLAVSLALPKEGSVTVLANDAFRVDPTDEFLVALERLVGKNIIMLS